MQKIRLRSRIEAAKELKTKKSGQSIRKKEQHPNEDNKKKLIIFDFDGVIIDSLPAIFQIYDLICEKLSIEKSDDIKNGDFYEVDYKETLAKLGVIDEESIKIAETLYRDNIPVLRKLAQPFPEIKKIFKKLEINHKIAIVSNNNKPEIETRLKEIGILDTVNMILDFSFHKVKPDPGQIIHCMEELGVMPHETVFVGDMEGDMDAAKRANVRKIIGVTYGYHSKHKMSKADVLVDKPSDLLSAIEAS
ncbi:HAD family hydrolase [Nanoarchaeota archaeon]